MGTDSDRGTAGWPLDLAGVTETVVATCGPNGRWNQAALGVHAPDPPEEPEATALTYGRTRTRRNFEREGEGVVQFTADPREFVDAALTIRETEKPTVPNADAWVRVVVERVDARTAEDGTEILTWRLEPTKSRVVEERVHRINRGFGAVVDATVAASRLDVEGYDEATLLDRLRYFAETVERCGGPREREAFSRIDDATGWRDRFD